MKRLSLFNKIVFAINNFFALLLLLACLVPYVPADQFPYISIFGLVIPLLVFANLMFCIYWMLLARKQFLLSLPILIFGYLFFGPFVKLSNPEEVIDKNDLSVMSFNVRNFNMVGGTITSNVFQKAFDFIAKEDPDIICFQEITSQYLKHFKKYGYKSLISVEDRSLLGIFSKYPIINEGTLNWPTSANNGAFVDIVYKKDTVRIYNLHMQSFGVNPSRKALAKEPSVRFYKHLTKIFRKQSEQAKLFLKHSKSIPYKTIICGDFNNTQFSNSYRLVKGGLQDTFVEKGSGFGRTFNFLRFPYRIDFILVDKAFEVRSHKNFDVQYSDHFPVMASFRLLDQ